MQSQLERYLDRIRTLYNDDERIQFSHAKHEYQIEIPIEYVEGSRKPPEFDFTS